MLIDWDAMLPPAPAACPDETDPAEQSKHQPAIVPQRDKSGELSGIDDESRRDDDRRYCTECGNLNMDGRCLAAARREIVANRGYTPIRDMLRRCEGFKPLPSDPDQRPGRIKWGGRVAGIFRDAIRHHVTLKSRRWRDGESGRKCPISVDNSCFVPACPGTVTMTL